MPFSNRVFPFLLAVIFLLPACSGVKSGAGRGLEQSWSSVQNEGRLLEDFEHFPQQAVVFADRAGSATPLLSAQQQAEEAERLRQAFYRPWTMKKSGLSPATFAASMTGYAKTIFYGQNLLPIPAMTRKELTTRTGIAGFPSLAEHGIVTRETSMRVLPTLTPFYHAPWKAGEGYPFDMLQHGVLRQGTPLFISHVSTDGTWFFCETAWGAGWLPVDAVAITDSTFEDAWSALPLAVIIRENASLFSTEADTVPARNIEDRPGNASACQSAVRLHIGTLLPYRACTAGQMTILLPARDEHGKALFMNYSATVQVAAPFPWPFTAANMAILVDQLMGAPYEWGGMYGGRDCSLLTRELFQTVGIFLPTNSARQLASGTPQQLDSMTPDEKVRFIKNNAIPFRTLVGFPGHVALYLGEWDNEPAIVHCIWGLRTKREGREGRLLIGKVAITSLNPGMEWADVRAGAPLLNRLKVMSVLP